ncbi:hypothetical protein [Candidatus Clostridium stratigraminis]|uniref:Uncharacterized protein n=1 Tax=Candidatus Clostridium stratigraminis TaxID=3381661 RepID=A0ABW8T741_9CLOT
MIKQILKSRFLVFGLLIGFVSVSIANIITSKSAIWAHNRLPWWMFILPPIALYVGYKAFIYKGKK